MKNKLLIFTYILSFVLAGSFTSCDDDDNGSDVVVLDAYGPSPAVRGHELKFLGKNLDKVSEIILPEDVSVTDINVISTSEIRIVVPEETLGGGVVVLKTLSGDITTKTKLEISEPIAVTNVYKRGTENERTVIAGDYIVIEGDYLNLVKEVLFQTSAAVSLNREEGGEYDRYKIEVQVPLGAQSGIITVSNGEEIPIYVASEDQLEVTLPSFASISATQVYPGLELTITGTNLQLVKAVRFTPNKDVEVAAPSEPFAPLSEIKVVVPEGILSGSVSLVTYSGVEVDAGTVDSSAPFVESELPTKANLRDNITLDGYNLDKVKSISLNDVSTTSFNKQVADQLMFSIPSATKLGENTVKLYDQDGKEQILGTIEITNVEAIKSTDLMFMDFDPHGEHVPQEWDPSWGSVVEFVTEDNGNVYARINTTFGAEQWVVNCNHQDTEGTLIPVIDDVTKYVMKVDMKVESDFTVGTENEYTLVIASTWNAKSTTFFPLAADGKTCTTGGGWITVTIDLADFGLSGSLDLSKKGDTGLYIKTDGMNPTGLCMDNWRFSKK